MKHHQPIRVVIVLLSVLFICFTTSAQISQYQTKDLRLIYLSPGYSYLVPHTARSFENALTFHKKFWNYKPSEPVSILLNDFEDVGNGGTLVIPWNFLSIGISPFDYSFNIIPGNERMQWLMNHELTHVVMCDKASNSDKFYRKAFLGKVMPDPSEPVSMVYSYFTTPRWYSPRWFHEGIAVFMETWMSGGMGRVLGGYDEMVFRTMAKDSARFYRLIGLETEGTTIDFQVGVNSYLYGTRFVSYLAYTYGVEKVQEFYKRENGSSRFYANQFKNVFGKDVQLAWDEWIICEKQFQHQNLLTIRENQVTSPKRIIQLPLGSVSKTFYNKKNRKLYAAVNFPGEMAHIVSIGVDDGEMNTISPVGSPSLYSVTSVGYDADSNRIFVSTHNRTWRGLSMIDAETGKETKLIEYSRAGDFAFNPADRSLWGIQHINGRANIVRMADPYQNIEEIFSLPFGKSFYDLEISSDGKLLMGTITEVTGRQKLALFNIDELMNGKDDYVEIYEFEDNVAANFVFSEDNKFAYGVSYYTGVSNVFRIDLITHEAEILTNAETGFFRPVVISDDSLMVMEYTTNGMIPGLIKIQTRDDVNAIEYIGQKVYEKNPEVENWMLPPPSTVNIDSLKQFEGTYSTFKGIKLASAYPIIEGYDDLVAFGYRANFMDYTSLHSLTLRASYSNYSFLPEKQRMHLFADYNYWKWNLTAAYNKANFFDLFGPTKVSRAGYAVTLKYHDLIINKLPVKLDYYLRLGVYGDLEKLPSFQNIESPYTELYTFTGNLHYTHLRKSLGAIENEQGFEWDFYATSYLAKKSFYPAVISNQDFGFLLPWRNSSFWLRTSLGNSFGERKNTLSNIYFGGFGNNWVDYQEALRYRDFESFPGVEINEISAHNFAKLTSEINLRPLRFRNAGMLGFYATYARLSFFGMGLFTDLDSPDLQRNIFNAGAQVDFELVIFSLIKTTLSFGYAKAFEDNFLPKDQFMLSLKLL